MTEQPQPARFDYDGAVFRHGIAADAAVQHSILRDEYRDVHPRIADALATLEANPVLDMGSGTGTLGALLDKRGVPWVGIDRSVTRVSNASGPRLLADATAVPFADGAFAAVAALYVLYHLADPLDAVREAARVLQPGGVFVSCAPSRHNYPELAAHIPPEPLATFDAENGPGQVAAVFEDVQVEPWDMHLFRLPDAQAVWTHLVARQIDPADAEAAARKVTTPLWVRARGAVIWGRNPR